MINKKLKIIIVISLVLLFLYLASYARLKNYIHLDNILIFNLYESHKNSKKEKYIFDISSEEAQKSNVNLYETCKKETLIKEKVAPGTKGEFELILTCKKANGPMKYQVTFNSENIKPQNLLFNIKGEEEKYKNLEDLSGVLQGVLKKDDTDAIVIQWLWNYEGNLDEDIQDTLDGKTIEAYNFNVNILSYEI